MSGAAVALLDINVLVALFDPRHVHHEAAHSWFSQNAEAGWATCPFTENGFVRVVSNPHYEGRRTTVQEAVRLLALFRQSGPHQFWPATPSLADPGRLDFHHVTGHRQITDAYLLALAVENEGRLATFDRAISPEAVGGAEARHLELVPA